MKTNQVPNWRLSHRGMKTLTGNGWTIDYHASWEGELIIEQPTEDIRRLVEPYLTAKRVWRLTVKAEKRQRLTGRCWLTDIVFEKDEMKKAVWALKVNGVDSKLQVLKT